MRVFARIIALFIIAFVVYSCGNSTEGMEKEDVQPRETEEAELINKRTYYDMTGEKLKESYYVMKDSEYVKHGPYKMYHEEGVVAMEYNYDQGHPDGMVIDYYPDGQIFTKYNYKDGKPNGPFEWYYQNGQLKVSGVYTNGVYSDTLKEYSESGELLKVTTDFSELATN